MTSEIRPWLRLSGVLAVAVVLGATWWLAPIEPTQLGTIGGAALVIASAAGELLPLPRPAGRGVPLSFAILGTAALLAVSPFLVVALGVVAWLISVIVAGVQGHEVRRFSLVTRVLGGWAMAGATGLGILLAPGLTIETGGGAAHQVNWLSLVFVSAVILLGLPAVEAAETAHHRAVSMREQLAQLIRAGWGGSAALAAAAALGGLTYGTLGPWALLMVLLPLLAARAGLKKYADIRRTYDETVRAMSHLPEHVGTVPEDHGPRVEELTLTTARLLGLPRETMTALERAAHLHELGRIRLDPGEDAPQKHIAMASASIIREAGGLDEVAVIVDGDTTGIPEAALPATILRLACELDRETIPPGTTEGETLSALLESAPDRPRVAAAMAQAFHEDVRVPRPMR